MRGGSGVGLIVAGAILYWVVDLPLPFVDEHALGGILMVAGLVALVARLLADAHRPQPNAAPGIGMVLVGAILTWAVRVDLPVVDAKALGVVLLIAGAVTIGVTVFMSVQQSRTRNVVEYRYK